MPRSLRTFAPEKLVSTDSAPSTASRLRHCCRHRHRKQSRPLEETVIKNNSSFWVKTARRKSITNHLLQMEQQRANKGARLRSTQYPFPCSTMWLVVSRSRKLVLAHLVSNPWKKTRYNNGRSMSVQCISVGFALSVVDVFIIVSYFCMSADRRRAYSIHTFETRLPPSLTLLFR